MSNKLVKKKEQKPGISPENKRKLFLIGLAVLGIAFIGVWTNVAVTSSRFKEQMETMVLGQDYFIEDVLIKAKKAEDTYSTGTSTSTNYFFYYGFDPGERMQVPGSIYEEYEVQEKIPAYTTDHKSYSYEKHGILPDNEFLNNELRKAVGIILGAGICGLLFWRWIDR